MRSISRGELQLRSLTKIGVRGTKIGKLDLRGCPILTGISGADEAGRDVLTAEGVYRG